MKEKLIKKIPLFLIILVFLALLVRVVKFNDLVSFDTDQEFFAFDAKKIIIDHKLTLIGIPTQFGGVLIGPLFTYLSTFFFLILKGNPSATHVLTLLLNLSAVPISYFVAQRLADRKIAIITAILVAFSKSSILDSLAGWAVTPVLVTTFIFIYLMQKFIEGRQKYLPLIFITIAVGLNWHIMSGFYLIVFVFSLLIFKIKPNLKYLSIGIISFFIILSPLIFFDLRHDFINTKGALSLFQNKSQLDFVKNFQNIISISFSNAKFMIFPEVSKIASLSTLMMFISFFLITLKNKKIRFYKFLCLFLVTVVLSASVYKGHISEQYLGALSAVFLLMTAIVISKLPKTIIFLLIFIFCWINLFSLKDSYSSLTLKYKMEAVSYIVSDSQDKDFILHIDSGHGMGSGFKYLFYYLKKEPKEVGEHLYLISIPWSQKETSVKYNVKNNYKAVSPIYKLFGDIGVIKIY